MRGVNYLELEMKIAQSFCDDKLGINPIRKAVNLCFPHSLGTTWTSL